MPLPPIEAINTTMPKIMPTIKPTITPIMGAKIAIMIRITPKRIRGMPKIVPMQVQQRRIPMIIRMAPIKIIIKASSKAIIPPVALTRIPKRIL